VGIGLACERHFVRFESAGSWQQRALRYLVAIVVVIVLHVGLSALFADWVPEPFWRVLRYTVVTIWITLGAPGLFLWTGLASSKNIGAAARGRPQGSPL
jgi:hypothetical protein